MRSVDLTAVTWRKSSYSNPDGGQCLEVVDNLPTPSPLVPVRDPQQPPRARPRTPGGGLGVLRHGRTT